MANIPLAAPYRDPPNGGYSNQLADNLQWYWDEGNVNVGTGYNLSDPGNITLNSLLFVDYPKSPQANTIIDFTTRLVGVGAAGQGLAALGSNFKWTWKGGGGACGNTNLRRNITPGCGDTSDIAEIPEPATLALVLIGVVGLIFIPASGNDAFRKAALVRP